jgi:hypothetical protein
MAVRRLLLATALLLLGLAFLSAVSTTPPSQRAEKPAPRPPAAPPPRATGRLPEDRRVRARVGDEVVVTLTSAVPDTFEVLDLGLETPVEPELGGRLDFIADRPGRFPVTRVSDGREVGVLLVTAAGPRDTAS